MAGTSQKTTTVGVRVPNELLAQWQADAQQAGLPVSGYLLARAQGGAVEGSGSAVGPVVYFIQAGENGPVKIGWSKKVAQRVIDLQTGNPVKLEVLRVVEAEQWAEGWFHGEFDDLWLQGEWFSFDPRMLSLAPPMEKPVAPKKLPTTLRPRSIKISAATWERWQAQARDRSLSVTALIVEQMDLAALEDLVGTERNAALEATNAKLIEERDKWRVLAKALQPADERLPAEVDRTQHHQSGPVLASAVPVVDGNTGWSGLKGSEKKGKRA